MKGEIDFREKTKEHTVLYDGHVLHACRDTVILPNGKEGLREYCMHDGAVAIVPLTAKHEIICVRQYRYALGRCTLEIPAGKLNSPQEDPLDAAKRELQEETGFFTENIRSIGKIHTSPALLTETIHLYLAQELISGQSHPDEDEFLEVVSFPLESFVQKILEGEITDAKTQTAILKVWEMQQRGLL